MSRPSPSALRRGFTLIELMVAIGILALITAGAFSSISAVDGARTREAAGKVSAAVRESFDRAALSGEMHRLIFEVGGSTLRLESAQGLFTLPAVSKGLGESAEERESRLAEEEDDLYDGLSDEAKEGLKALREPPTWSPVDGPLGEGVELGRAKVLSFWSDATETFQSTGVGVLYFFPRGETQDSVFWIGESDDETFTVRIDGMAARIQAKFGRYDHSGKEP
jgi:general secretion pathway protein H